MTRNLILSVHLFLFISFSLFSQVGNVTIYGKNKEYAGKELEFFIYRERIFNIAESLAKTKVDSSGVYSFSFSLVETQCVFCKTPLYTAYIFAEPGKSYQVDLPPIPENDAVKNNNPFFIAPLWHMVPFSNTNAFAGKLELNAAIDSFERQFEPFLNRQILRYYDPRYSREKLDSFIIASNNFAEPENKEYYESYRLFKLATLGFMVNQFSRDELYEKYLKNKPVHVDVPSWWEFFNLYFDGYFGSLTTKKEYSQLYPLIGKGNYFSFNQLLKNDPSLQNDQIREWVILKEIFKAYYENGLPLSTVLAICDSLSAGSTDKITISISEIIKKEVASLLPGSLPPSSLLMNADGDSTDISSFRGKYCYIGFCSLDNLGCLGEFEYLKYFYHKHGKFLDIVIILPESEKDRIPSFTDENAIPWKFWYCLNSIKTLKEYKVRAYPVFYLLDREGKLIMSPAILPSAGFEQQLFNILKGRREI
jgi:hypothetical protein